MAAVQLNIFDAPAPDDDVPEPRMPRFATRPRELLALVAQSADREGWARFTSRQLAERLDCSIKTIRSDLCAMKRNGTILADPDREADGAVVGLKIRIIKPLKQAAR